jgi:hypothetical protein
LQLLARRGCKPDPLEKFGRDKRRFGKTAKTTTTKKKLPRIIPIFFSPL